MITALEIAAAARNLLDSGKLDLFYDVFEDRAIAVPAELRLSGAIHQAVYQLDGSIREPRDLQSHRREMLAAMRILNRDGQ